MFQIRELVGERDISMAEKEFQELIVRPLSHIDTCLTRSYDLRLAAQDPLPVLEACEFQVLHQMVLDCASAFTDELYKLTRLTFLAVVTGHTGIQDQRQQRIAAACTRAREALSPASATRSRVGFAACRLGGQAA